MRCQALSQKYFSFFLFFLPAGTVPSTVSRCHARRYFIHSLSTLYYYNAPSLTAQLTGDYRDRTCTGKCSSALLDHTIIIKRGPSPLKNHFDLRRTNVRHRVKTMCFVSSRYPAQNLCMIVIQGRKNEIQQKSRNKY